MENGTDGDDVIAEYLREMKNHGDDPDSPFWRGGMFDKVVLSDFKERVNSI